MPKAPDWEKVKGEVYGRLTVLEFVGRGSSGKPLVRVACECGAVLVVRYPALRSGTTGSCGCLHHDIIYKHGLSSEPLYIVLLAMLQRCAGGPETPNFKSYGAKGITVCLEWAENPKEFIRWAKNNGYKRGLEIDRRDNSRGYSPDNCRWVTRAVNVNNVGTIKANNSSGYRGVHLRKDGKYMVQVRVTGHPFLFKAGFKTATEAAQCRDAHCIIHEIDTPLNFPELKPA